MRIQNHILDGVDYIEAASHGGIITPKFLVMHYTAGWTAKGAIDLFKSGSRKTSAHLILERDGTLTQMLPFNVKGHHVGTSYWRGYAGLNSHSIGIEIVNYGDAPLWESEQVVDRRGRPVAEEYSNPGDWIISDHQLYGGPRRRWQKFTQVQFDILDILTPLLVETYNLREIVGHEEVATPPGRKPDPGPAFPLSYYKQFADYANADSEGRYVVTTDDLNCRGGPGTNFAILRKFKSGDAVKGIKSNGDGWVLVEWNDTNIRKRGWVYESYLIRA